MPCSGAQAPSPRAIILAQLNAQLLRCRLEKISNARKPLRLKNLTIVILKVRLDWTRSNAKQPKFDVIDSSRKVATGRNLREQLRNIACLQAVVR